MCIQCVALEPHASFIDFAIANIAQLTPGGSDFWLSPGFFAIARFGY